MGNHLHVNQDQYDRPCEYWVESRWPKPQPYNRISVDKAVNAPVSDLENNVGFQNKNMNLC